MDYAPHGSLRHKHAKGTPLPLATIIPYVQQVAAALQYAHDQKLIHRDIKPENMLLGKHNDVLVSDFGLAVVARSTRSWEEQKIAGTAPYMSPEHFRAKAVPAGDQYSLAVAVYEWLTGSPPFDEGDFMQLGYQHRFEPVPPLREKNSAITVPALLEQVVMKGLAKEPGQRFERIEAFANALEQALKPQNPIIVTPPTPPKPAIVSPPIGTTLVTYREHTGWVNAIAWTPDGTYIASGSRDSSVQIWDARTGSQKSSYKTNVTVVVAWSPDGKRLAYGGYDHTVHVWDAMQQREILQYSGHSDWIYALSWSPDGRYIVSGGGYAAGKAQAHDFTLHIWDTTTGTRLSTYKGHAIDVRAIQWSPDGRYIASGDHDNVVRVWEVTTGRLVYTYTKHTLYVMAIAWSRDSRQLASGSRDKSVQVWDATTGKTIYAYKGHSNDVHALSWSPNSTRIASGGNDNTVQVWQAR